LNSGVTAQAEQIAFDLLAQAFFGSE